jgi:hypothetical protein
MHPVIMVGGPSPPNREYDLERACERKNEHSSRANGADERQRGGRVSSSDILERPDVRDSDTGNANEVFHYVKKNKIAESAVMGTMVEALCGEVFPVTKSPKPGSPVCPACKEVYQSLKK